MIHILIAIIIATAEGLGDYELILRHKDTRQGYFARDILTTGVENVNNPEANTYSIIGNINPNDYVDKDGYYRLKIIYGSVNGLPTILEWKQTSWITADTITGFVPINIIPPETVGQDCPHCLFQGLSSGNDVGTNTETDATYLDGNDDHAHTWNSIGRVSAWNSNQMPGFNGIGAYSCALYIFDPPTPGPVITDPRECLTTPTNMVAWYDSDSIDVPNLVWTDKIGGQDGTIIAATGIAVFDGADNQNELYLNGQTIVSGTYQTKIDFGNPGFMAPDHTVFNLCKYTSYRGKSWRILDAKQFDGLYGFWGRQSGLAREGTWITLSAPSNFGNNWVLSSQRLDSYRGNGVDLTLSGRVGFAVASNLDINNCDDTLRGNCASENSDWACGEIIVVNEKLNDNEIQCVEDYFSCKYDLGLPAQCEPTTTTEEAIECARDATTFDWDKLTTDGIEQSPQIDVIEWNINVDETAQTDLTLNIEVRVPYVVRASADDQLTANFGTTYVLDFEDFDAHKSSITQPNTCSNRLESDYIGKTTTSSRFEILSDSLDAIGTNDNMCYPATDGSGWEIIKDDDCNSILYKGKWTWGELRECRNNGGALTDAGVQQTSVDNTDPNYLQLFGTFYVNMISPFWYEDYANKDPNMDFYRVYQLISQPFVIQISKSVYVIGSTGINVMTMSIIAVYKEDQDEDYILILLTEAAEYMELINGQIITVPQSTQFKLAMQSTSESTGCLNNKAYLCSQLWKIYTTEQTCDTDRDELTNPTGGIDFSGDYQLRFTPQCRQNVDETHCLDWLEKHPIYKNDNDNNNNVQNGVILSSHLTFVDGICEAKTFTIQLEATMNFYENADYTGYIDPESSPHLYEVGVDTVYGEIKLVFPTATEDIFDSELINVWLCTFPPGTDPLPPDQNGPNIAAHDATNGGCFSNLRDGFTIGEGDEFFFHVYGENIAEEDFIVNQNGNEGNDVIQFEFTVPHEIQRDTLYVHAQVEVLLEELPRRRLLLDIKTKPRGAATNKIAHFGRNIGITNQPNNNKPKQPPQEPISPISPIQQPPASQPFTISLNSTWVIIIGALLSIILLFNIILMCYMNCCKSNNGRAKISFSKNRRNGYDSVKHIDSEQFDDSEANLINVN